MKSSDSRTSVSCRTPFCVVPDVNRYCFAVFKYNLKSHLRDWHSTTLITVPLKLQFCCCRGCTEIKISASNLGSRSNTFALVSCLQRHRRQLSFNFPDSPADLIFANTEQTVFQVVHSSRRMPKKENASSKIAVFA